MVTGTKDTFRYEFSNENLKQSLIEKNKIVPEKPFKGNFNVRIDPELHKKAVIIANKQGISLNKFIEHAVRNMIAI